jgi:LAO/AO transport system kinase
MTDTFLALMLPGAGDELQGIKKGLLELVDVVAVNKADGDNLPRARAAASSLKAALHILASNAGGEIPPVLTYSALENHGIAELWKALEAHRKKLSASGKLAKKHSEQQIRWMWSLVEDRLREKLKSDPKLKSKMPAIEKSVAEGKLPPALAAEDILKLLGII